MSEQHSPPAIFIGSGSSGWIYLAVYFSEGSGDQPATEALGHRGAAVARAELAVDAMKMGLHRANAAAKTVGRLSSREPVCRQLHNFPFPRSEERARNP